MNKNIFLITAPADVKKTLTKKWDRKLMPEKLSPRIHKCNNIFQPAVI